jgi:uncharacterized protein YjbI with pentapeptide repeats
VELIGAAQEQQGQAIMAGIKQYLDAISIPMAQFSANDSGETAPNQDFGILDLMVRGRILSGLDLRGASLEDINFCGADMYHIDLTDATLRGCKLSSCTVCDTTYK